MYQWFAEKLSANIFSWQPGSLGCQQHLEQYVKILIDILKDTHEGERGSSYLCLLTVTFLLSGLCKSSSTGWIIENKGAAFNVSTAAFFAESSAQYYPAIQVLMTKQTGCSLKSWNLPVLTGCFNYEKQLHKHQSTTT